MLVDAEELIASALEARRPVLAFNVITLEYAQAVVAGSSDAGRPVIVQVSENAARYHCDPGPLFSACAALAESSDSAVALHLDHVQDVDLLHEATELGVSSIMVDNSRLPYDENVRRTSEAVKWAHDRTLLVEAELGEIGGKVGHPHDPGVRTDPDRAAEFVHRTGVDTLAVAVGSEHGMTTRTAELDDELIARLASAVGVPLVLHGSSGVSDAGLRAAARAGIVKINVATLLNAAFTEAIRTHLSHESTDPRPYLAAARTAVRETVLRTQLTIAIEAEGQLTPARQTS